MEEFNFNRSSEVNAAGHKRKLIVWIIALVIIATASVGVFAYVTQQPVQQQEGEGLTGLDTPSGKDTSDIPNSDDTAEDTTQKADDDSSMPDWLSWLFGGKKTKSQASTNVSTSGAQGSVQQLNILSELKPSAGARFDLDTLQLQLVQNPVPGSVLSLNKKMVTAPTEGSYVVQGSIVNYTPSSDFVGQARGVGFSISDTAGVTASGSYKPVVTAPSVPPVATCQDPAAQSLRLANRRFYSDTSVNYSVPIAELNPRVFSMTGSSDATILYAQDDNYNLLKSIDQGKSWKAINASQDAQAYGVVSADNGKFVYVQGGKSGGIGNVNYRSTDGGVSWVEGEPIRAYGTPSVSESGDVMVVYGARSQFGDTMLARSTDGGLTWQEITLPVENGDGYGLAVSADGSVIYSSIYDYDLGDSRIYRSDDDGQSWTPSDLSGSLTSSGSIQTNQNGSVVTVIGSDVDSGVAKQYISMDYGQTWQEVAPPDGYTLGTLKWSANLSTVIMLTNTNEWFRSTNSGESWAAMTSPISSIYDQLLSSDGQTIIFDSGVVKEISTDGGASWTELPAARQSFDVSTVDLDPDTDGQQLTFDRSASEGWSAEYNTATGDLLFTINNIQLYSGTDPDTISPIQYTLVPAPNCTAPMPGIIRLARAQAE